MNDKLSFSIRKKGSITILDLHGKIIGSWAFAVQDEMLRLKDSGVSAVILNFQGVTSIDSLGVMAITSVLGSGLTIKIIYMNTNCRQIFEQNRAANVIPILGSEEEATGGMSIPTPISREMRKYKRINTNIPIEIVISDDSHRGVLLNISEGGALLGYLDPLNIEPYTAGHINLIMKLPFLGSIELEGKPVRFGRTSEMHTIGMELTSSEKNRNLIKRVCKEDLLSSDQSSFLYD